MNKVDIGIKEIGDLNGLLSSAKEIGVSGAYTTKWFSDISVIINCRINEIKTRELYLLGRINAND